MSKRLLLSSFSVVCGLSFLAIPSIKGIAAVYYKNPDYTHGPLVLLLCLFFGYKSWIRAQKPLGKPSLWFVFAGFAGGSLILLGRWYELGLAQGGLGTAFFSSLGLILCVVGCCLALGGRQLVFSIWFSLLFFICAVPLPVFLTSPLSLFLRSVAADMSAWWIGLLGLPVLQEGNVLHLAHVSLGVEDACSGIRSAGVLFSLSAAMAWWAGAGLLRGILLCSFSLVGAVLENALRVTAMAMIANHYGQQVLDGPVHSIMGVMTFGAVVSTLAFAVSRMNQKRKGYSAGAKAEGVPGTLEEKPAMISRPMAFAALAVIFFWGGCVQEILENHYAIKPTASNDRVPLARLPDKIGDFRLVKVHEFPENQRVKIAPADFAVRTYRNSKGVGVKLVILYWFPFTSRTVYEVYGPHLPDNCYPTFGWKSRPSYSQTRFISQLPDETVNQRLFESAGQSVVVFYWHRGIHAWEKNNCPSPVHLRLKALWNSWKKSSREFESRYIVTVEVPASVSVEYANETALDFVVTMAPLLPQHGLGDNPGHLSGY